MKRIWQDNRKWLVAGTLLLALVLGVVGWLEHTPLLAWYYVRGLARAGEGDRDGWVDQVVRLDHAAAPELIGRLAEDDQRVCDNVRLALARLLKTWGKGDARAVDLTGGLVAAFPRLSLTGQQAVLQMEAEWLRAEPGEPSAPPALLDAVARLLHAAEHGPAKEGRVATLDLASVLAAQPVGTDLLERCRALVSAGLRDPEPEVRTRAVQLARAPQLGLLEQVVALLHDSSASVRRSAMQALSPAANVIGPEDLLPWLHDPDAAVRGLCEVALRGRNLSDADLRLGKLLTSPDLADRLQAIQELLADADPDRDPFLTEPLRRLSHDPVASVRLAAIRAAAQRPGINLADRIREMTRSDPSPTVCQLAQYYLDSPARQNASWLGE